MSWAVEIVWIAGSADGTTPFLGRWEYGSGLRGCVGGQGPSPSPWVVVVVLGFGHSEREKEREGN